MYALTHTHTHWRFGSQADCSEATVLPEAVTHLLPRRVCHHSSDPISLEGEQHDSSSRGPHGSPSENQWRAAEWLTGGPNGFRWYAGKRKNTQLEATSWMVTGWFNPCIYYLFANIAFVVFVHYDGRASQWVRELTNMLIVMMRCRKLKLKSFSVNLC